MRIVQTNVSARRCCGQVMQPSSAFVPCELNEPLRGAAIQRPRTALSSHSGEESSRRDAQPRASEQSTPNTSHEHFRDRRGQEKEWSSRAVPAVTMSVAGFDVGAFLLRSSEWHHP